MANGLNRFDPVGSFQKARSNALTIQGQEQALSQNQAASNQQQTNFDQKQVLQRARILNNTAKALRGIRESQRGAALTKLEPQLQQFGVPRGTVKASQLTDDGLDNAIAETGALIESFSTPGKFGRTIEGVIGGKPAFFQTSTGGQVREVQGVKPKVSVQEKKFAQSQRADEAKKAAGTQAKKQQASLVSSDIGRALEQSTGLTTGFTGGILSAVAGTPAFDLKENLRGIKANVGFDKLQSMRENSPTGGALGQVSDSENKLLQSVMGSVEQSQSKEQLDRNLTRLQVIFDAIVHGTHAIPFTQSQFDALPEGAIFIDPDDGLRYRK